MTDLRPAPPALSRAVGGLALALALVVTACSPTPSASPAPLPTETPTPTASGIVPPPTPVSSPAGTSVTGAPACAVADLKASHGLVEGAAGSRLTTVVLVSATTCSIDAFPALGLRDGNGAILVGAPAAGPGRIDLAPEAAYESNVRLANWCADEPTFPLVLEIVIGADAVVVTGTSFPEPGDLPPCNGTTGPILEATGWVAAT
jgi:hypothetical protein